MKNEIRVDIPGYEGIYEINKLGQVRSYWKNNNKENRVDTEPQRLLQPRRKHQKCYGDKAVITLFNGLKKQHFYVGRLMATVFLGYNPKDKTKQITYKDGNSMNNRLENIEIISISERQKRFNNFLKLSGK